MKDASLGNLPKQPRSRKTTEALLRVGLHKLEQHGLDGLSMAEVAAEAGSSIGSLYFRFGDKNQFVAAILARALDETREKMVAVLDAAEHGRWPTEKILCGWVATMVDVVRGRRGLLRVVIRQTLSDPEALDPIRILVRDLRDRLMLVLGGTEPLYAEPDWQRRLRIGVQVVHGALIAMVIGNPDALPLDDDATKEELALVVIRYLRAPAASDPAPAGSKRK